VLVGDEADVPLAPRQVFGRGNVGDVGVLPQFVGDDRAQLAAGPGGGVDEDVAGIARGMRDCCRRLG
jgi:hypothetical protein